MATHNHKRRQHPSANTQNTQTNPTKHQPTSHTAKKKLQNNKPPPISPRKTQTSNQHRRQIRHHILPLTNHGRKLHHTPRNNKHKKDNKNSAKIVSKKSRGLESRLSHQLLFSITGTFSLVPGS